MLPKEIISGFLRLLETIKVIRLILFDPYYPIANCSPQKRQCNGPTQDSSIFIGSKG
jgi:hypothetical protein